MSKIRELLTPYLAIIFGALLFLIYLNNLSQVAPEALALGIIGVILAIVYIGIGIVDVLAGDKLGKTVKTVFGVILVSSFPIFLFIETLLTTIQLAQLQAMGPTAWTIAIINMIASIAFVAIYCIARFVPQKVLKRLAFLFGAIFTLALLLDILFDITGAPTALGNIAIIMIALYVIYAVMLFKGLSELEEEAPKAEAQEAPVQEAEVEEVPSEEKVEEEATEEQEEPSEEPKEKEE